MGRKLLNRFFDVRSEEWGRILLLSAPLFLAMAIFWAIKPVKRGLFLSYHQDHLINFFGSVLSGAEAEQLVKIANVLVAWVLMLLLARWGHRVKRSHLLPGLCAVAVMAFSGFAFWSNDPNLPMVWSFYIFGDMFNTLALVLFWAFVSDTVSADEARRLYGPIGLGGVLGGLFGASVVKLGITGMGRETLLLLCIIPVGLIAVIGLLALRKTEGGKRAVLARSEAADETADFSAREALQSLLSSKYLMAIAVMVACYEIASGIVDFQFSTTVVNTITHPLERDEYFGMIGQIQSLMALIVQFLVTGFVLRRFGVGTALLVLPAVMMLGTVGFLVLPTLSFATALSVSDNSMSYSINQSARETLYVPVDPMRKHTARAFIDVFVQRSAKIVGVALNLGLVSWGSISQARWLSLVCLLVLAAWIRVVHFAGRRFERMVSAQAKMEPLGLNRA
jgi:AAA family ATP:ADP antiporter